MCAIKGALLVVLVTMLGTTGQSEDAWQYALAMHGEPAFPDGLQAPLPWVSADAPQGGILRLSEIGTFDSMNPYIVFGLPARGLGLVYQSLLYRSPDEPFTLYPQLARAIEVADDRSWIVFHLDPAARFQDGTPVTADDVLFTFEALRSEGKPHYQTFYAGVFDARAIDDLAVRFDLDGGNWELPMLLGLMPVLSRAYFETVPFERTNLEIPLGTGPYRVIAIEPGRRVVYQRDPDHWGNALPQNVRRNNFETIEYSWYRDSNVAHQAFLAGEIDLQFESDALRWATGYDAPAVTDGRIVLEDLPHGRPSGLLAVVWNQRRPPFEDIRVRQALSLAFDFTWTNATLLHDHYQRTQSLFDNSDLAATGPAMGGELALLEPWRDDLPAELFEAPYVWPQTDGSGRLREQLRQAADLLAQAGFILNDGILIDARNGEALDFELLLSDSSYERIMLPWMQNLERLGVRATLRTIDAAQYRTRTAGFDFDAMIWHWGVSLSPGNEQWIYWGGDAADDEGSRNYPGLRDPVVDALIAQLSDARSYEDLTAAARALDRVLMWGRHVLPLYYRSGDTLARWADVQHSDVTPLYGVDTLSWWRESSN